MSLCVMVVSWILDERCAQNVSEFLTQLLAGALEPGFDGIERRIENARYFLVGQALHLPEREDGAIFRLEFREKSVDRFLQLVGGPFRFGRRLEKSLGALALGFEELVPGISLVAG